MLTYIAFNLLNILINISIYFKVWSVYWRADARLAVDEETAGKKKCVKITMYSCSVCFARSVQKLNFVVTPELQLLVARETERC